MNADPKDCKFCESEIAKVRASEERDDERGADVHWSIYQGHLSVEHPLIAEALKASQEEAKPLI
jgi:hypothetical protein